MGIYLVKLQFDIFGGIDFGFLSLISESLPNHEIKLRGGLDCRLICKLVFIQPVLHLSNYSHFTADYDNTKRHIVHKESQCPGSLFHHDFPGLCHPLRNHFSNKDILYFQQSLVRQLPYWTRAGPIYYLLSLYSANWSTIQSNSWNSWRRLLLPQYGSSHSCKCSGT